MLEPVSVRAHNMQKRRARILAEARGLLARGGFEAMNLRDLARLAAVTVPTIYNLIGNKEEVIVALIGMRAAPFYIDYFTMRSMLQNLASEKRTATDRELRRDFDMRANTNYLIGYGSGDLVIDRDNGYLTLTVSMSDKKSLVGGVSLLMELDAKASAILN